MTTPSAVRREFWATAALGSLLLAAGYVLLRRAACAPEGATDSAASVVDPAALLNVGLGFFALGVVMLVVAAVEVLLGVSRPEAR